MTNECLELCLLGSFYRCPIAAADATFDLAAAAAIDRALGVAIPVQNIRRGHTQVQLQLWKWRPAVAVARPTNTELCDKMYALIMRPNR